MKRCRSSGALHRYLNVPESTSQNPSPSKGDLVSPERSRNAGEALDLKYARPQLKAPDIQELCTHPVYRGTLHHANNGRPSFPHKLADPDDQHVNLSPFQNRKLTTLPIFTCEDRELLPPQESSPANVLAPSKDPVLHT